MAFIDLVLLFIITLIGAYVGYNYYMSQKQPTTTTTATPVGTTTTLVSIGNDNNVYALVNDVEFVQNTYSYGNINDVYQDCNSVIQCSNYLFNDPTSTGANYLPDTKTCELVSAISPIGVNQDNSNTTLILRTSSRLTNGVNAWAKNDTVTSPGNLYCSPTLAYRDYAKALCANIPYCKAYTYEIDSAGVPYGCLKATNTTIANSGSSVQSVSYYSGKRSDGQDLPSAPFNYTYNTDVTGAQIIASYDKTDLLTCIQLATVKNTARAAWNYSPNGGGSCRLFNYYDSAVPSMSSILMTHS